MKKSMMILLVLCVIALVVGAVVFTFHIKEVLIIKAENHNLKKRIGKHEFLIEQVEAERMWSALDAAMISLHIQLVCSREVGTNEYLAFIKTGQVWATLFLDYVMVQEQRGWMTYSRVSPQGQIDIFLSVYGERVGPAVERNTKECRRSEKASEKVLDVLINHLQRVRLLPEVKPEN